MHICMYESLFDGWTNLTLDLRALRPRIKTLAYYPQLLPPWRVPHSLAYPFPYISPPFFSQVT
jgi:hypothetical protein